MLARTGVLSSAEPDTMAPRDPLPFKKPTDFVYRSRYRHEVDLLAEHLEQADIPFRPYVEGPMGVATAMPLGGPIGTLPGSWYVVFVPASHSHEANEVLESLPISRGDD